MPSGDLICPKCGSDNVWSTTIGWGVPSSRVGGHRFVGMDPNRHACDRCGNKFKRYVSYRIRAAALRQDLDGTLFRVCVTQDNSEIIDLSLDQLHMLAAKYPCDCDQLTNIRKLIKYKEDEKTTGPTVVDRGM